MPGTGPLEKPGSSMNPPRSYVLKGSDTLTVSFPSLRRRHARHLLARAMTKLTIQQWRMEEMYDHRGGPLYGEDWGAGVREVLREVYVLLDEDGETLTTSRNSLWKLAGVLRDGKGILAEPTHAGGEREPINLTDIADSLIRICNSRRN